MRFGMQKCLKITVLYVCVLFLVNVLMHILPIGGFGSVHPQTSPNMGEQNEQSLQVGDKFTSNRSIGMSQYMHNNTIFSANHQNHKLHGNFNNTVRAEYQNFETILKNDTRTAVSRPTELRDVFISVKTTGKYHTSRVGLILETWWIIVYENTYFFTDEYDANLTKATRGHVINTNCSSSHARNSLCCKMSVEYDHFIISNKRWWCHVDDDTYLNTGALEGLLQGYDHTLDWYIGRPSLNHAVQFRHTVSPGQGGMKFWFATGGAGFCLSRPLALKIMSHIGGGRLKSTCATTRLPDDCTIGYIVKYVAHGNLTVIRTFHSHLEALYRITTSDVHKQISLSYAYNDKKNSWNVVGVKGFPIEEDPTRFRSIHCRIYPYLKECPEAIFGVQ